MVCQGLPGIGLAVGFQGDRTGAADAGTQTSGRPPPRGPLHVAVGVEVAWPADDEGPAVGGAFVVVRSGWGSELNGPVAVGQLTAVFTQLVGSGIRRGRTSRRRRRR